MGSCMSTSRITLSPIIQSLKRSLLSHGVPNDFNDSTGVLKGDDANDDTHIHTLSLARHD